MRTVHRLTTSSASRQAAREQRPRLWRALAGIGLAASLLFLAPGPAKATPGGVPALDERVAALETAVQNQQNTIAQLQGLLHKQQDIIGALQGTVRTQGEALASLQRVIGGLVAEFNPISVDAQGNVTVRGNLCATNLCASHDIQANGKIKAGSDIAAGHDVSAVHDMNAMNNISAQAVICNGVTAALSLGTFGDLFVKGNADIGNDLTVNGTKIAGP